MMQSKLVKILLAPISLIYGLIISVRDLLYRWGLLRGVRFSVPTISVGNLSIGGAGKSPHIEYLVRLLKDYIYVATLSRGYGRKTRGFSLVQPNNTAEQVGDEPLQFKRKFPHITVSISESRTFAIPELLKHDARIQTILLDDAFQHRAIHPDLNILLTEYQYPFTRDYLLPSGRLREWRSAYQRADYVIVSKCPPVLTTEDRQKMMQELHLLPRQKIFFSYYDYQRPNYIFDYRRQLMLDDQLDILVICAIARTEYLLDYLNPLVKSVQILEYEDHHYFTNFDLSNLKKRFAQMEGSRKVIITTEKDAMRLQLHQKFIVDNLLPIFAIPVVVKFHGADGEQFDEAVKNFLLEYKG